MINNSPPAVPLNTVPFKSAAERTNEEQMNLHWQAYWSKNKLQEQLLLLADKKTSSSRIPSRTSLHRGIPSIPSVAMGGSSERFRPTAPNGMLLSLSELADVGKRPHCKNGETVQVIESTAVSPTMSQNSKPANRTRINVWHEKGGSHKKGPPPQRQQIHEHDNKENLPPVRKLQNPYANNRRVRSYVPTACSDDFALKQPLFAKTALLGDLERRLKARILVDRDLMREYEQVQKQEQQEQQQEQQKQQKQQEQQKQQQKQEYVKSGSSSKQEGTTATKSANLKKLKLKIMPVDDNGNRIYDSHSDSDSDSDSDSSAEDVVDNTGSEAELALLATPGSSGGLHAAKGSAWSVGQYMYASAEKGKEKAGAATTRHLHDQERGAGSPLEFTTACP